MKFSGVLASLLLVGILASCGSTETNTTKEVELTISAAASLQDALEELQKNYEHTNIKIIYNFGGSGALQQQILNGAPVDLFFQHHKINLMS